MPSVSIVIAAHNEVDSIGDVFDRCRAVLARCVDDAEIVMVDDGSTDGTGEKMDRIRDRHPDLVRVIRHHRNMGIAHTFEAAYRAGTKEYVLDIPADGEYPPEVLESMVPLLGSYDIIIAERAQKSYGPYRRLVSGCYRWLPRLMFGVDLRDPGSVKCRRREVIHGVRPASRGVFAEAERTIRAIRKGYRLGVVEIKPERRVAGSGGGAAPGLVLQAGIDMLTLWVRLSLLRRPP